MKYKIWNKKEALITPVGEYLTKEQVIAKYPAAEFVDFIIADSPVQLQVFMQYDAYVDIKKEEGLVLSGSETKQQVLDKITAFELAQRNKPLEPSAEERIAAALEFDNLLKL